MFDSCGAPPRPECGDGTRTVQGTLQRDRYRFINEANSRSLDCRYPSNLTDYYWFSHTIVHPGPGCPSHPPLSLSPPGPAPAPPCSLGVASIYGVSRGVPPVCAGMTVGRGAVGSRPKRAKKPPAARLSTPALLAPIGLRRHSGRRAGTVLLRRGPLRGSIQRALH